MNKLRIYFDTTGKIIYHIGLEGTGQFPKTSEKELEQLPVGTQLLETTDRLTIDTFYSHENNMVNDGVLIPGTLILPPPPPPKLRNALSEIDALKQTLIEKGIL